MANAIKKEEEKKIVVELGYNDLKIIYDIICSTDIRCIGCIQTLVILNELGFELDKELRLMITYGKKKGAGRIGFSVTEDLYGKHKNVIFKEAFVVLEDEDYYFNEFWSRMIEHLKEYEEEISSTLEAFDIPYKLEIKLKEGIIDERKDDKDSL